MIELEIEIGNSSLAIVREVKNAFEVDYDDGADLKITLFDKAGVPVAPQTFPAQMFNEPGGTYAATLDADLELQLNHTYIAEVNGVGSGGEIMHIREKVKAVSRGSAC